MIRWPCEHPFEPIVVRRQEPINDATFGCGRNATSATKIGAV